MQRSHASRIAVSTATRPWRMPRFGGQSKHRREGVDAQRRIRVLEGGADLALPVELPNRRHVYNQFVLRAKSRDGLRSHLAARGIGAEVYYPQTMHLQKCFAGWGHDAGAFAIAERAADESLAIPIYPELTEEMQATVVAAVRDFYHG